MCTHLLHHFKSATDWRTALMKNTGLMTIFKQKHKWNLLTPLHEHIFLTDICQEVWKITEFQWDGFKNFKKLCRCICDVAQFRCNHLQQWLLKSPQYWCNVWQQNDTFQQRRLNIGREVVKMLRTMETYEKQKNPYQLCLLLLNNNVDLKNNKRNYRKFTSIQSR